MTRAYSSAPQTQGILIRRARAYDGLVQVLMLGQAHRLRRSIADIVDAQAGDAILDVGCGTGDLALILAGRVGAQGRVVGIDASPEMIARAQHKARRAHSPVEFRLAVAEELPFADQAFDRVVTSFVLHHLPGDLKRRAIASTVRVLKTGGHLTIVDFLTTDERIGRHGASPTDAEPLPNWLREARLDDVSSRAVKVRSIGELLGWPPLTSVRAEKANP
jgi:ubiquinone/menaquinone biosynthesis C-methylase UbiE